MSPCPVRSIINAIDKIYSKSWSAARDCGVGNQNWLNQIIPSSFSSRSDQTGYSWPSFQSSKRATCHLCQPATESMCLTRWWRNPVSTNDFSAKPRCSEPGKDGPTPYDERVLGCMPSCFGSCNVFSIPPYENYLDDWRSRTWFMVHGSWSVCLLQCHQWRKDSSWIQYVLITYGNIWYCLDFKQSSEVFLLIDFRLQKILACLNGAMFPICIQSGPEAIQHDIAMSQFSLRASHEETTYQGHPARYYVSRSDQQSTTALKFNL